MVVIKRIKNNEKNQDEDDSRSPSLARAALRHSVSDQVFVLRLITKIIMVMVMLIIIITVMVMMIIIIMVVVMVIIIIVLEMMLVLNIA